MRIGIGIIAYNVAKPLDDLIKSVEAHQHSEKNLTPGEIANNYLIFLHQHSTRESQPEVTAVCEEWARHPWIRYTYHGQNRGLSASWNDTLIQGYDVENCDVVLLVNDDITFSPGSLDSFAEYAVSRRDAYMVTTLGYHHYYAKRTELGQQPLWGFGFSCFAINPIGWETLGCFDENIAPIYFEDCDYGQRGFLAGLHMAEHKGCGIIHWGSLSAKQDGQAEYLAQKNPLSSAYYTKKWGCLPGLGEQYTRPFNKEGWNGYWRQPDDKSDLTGDWEEFLPLKIYPRNRHKPYGPLYDRYDIAGREGSGGMVIEEDGSETFTETPELLPYLYTQPVNPEHPIKRGTGGNTCWTHINRWIDFAKQCNGVIVEVGLGCGDGSTHAFEIGLKANPAEYKRHIGVSLHNVGGGWEQTAEYWDFVEGNSTHLDTVNTVGLRLGAMLGEVRATTKTMTRPGIIFIDTTHDYETLKRELEIWPDLGDESTLYLFHDVVGFPTMTQAIIESVAPGGRFHNSHDFVVVDPSCSGLGALVPKAGWPQ